MSKQHSTDFKLSAIELYIKLNSIREVSELLKNLDNNQNEKPEKPLIELKEKQKDDQIISNIDLNKTDCIKCRDNIKMNVGGLLS